MTNNQAPLAAKHGGDVMNVVWDALVPQHHKVVAGLPSLEALVDQASSFGYMESLHHRDYEPHSLGSMRVYSRAICNS